MTTTLLTDSVVRAAANRLPRRIHLGQRENVARDILATAMMGLLEATELLHQLARLLRIVEEHNAAVSIAYSKGKGWGIVFRNFAMREPVTASKPLLRDTLDEVLQQLEKNHHARV